MREQVDAEPNERTPIRAGELLGYEEIGCDEQPAPERSLVLKAGSLFLLTNGAGDVMPPGACELGLFHEDTRVLSNYELTVAGRRPDLLTSQAQRVFASQIDLTITDLGLSEIFTEPKNFLHIRREQLLDGALFDRLVLTNHTGRAVELSAGLRFAADYADLFEVRGARRERRGEFYEPRIRDGSVVWGYRGLDGRLRETRFEFSPAPNELGPANARWDFEFQPSGEAAVEVRVIPAGEGRAASVPVPDLPFENRFMRLRRDYDAWHQRSTRFRCDDGFYNAALRQSITDLHALMLDYEGHRIVTAGIPWFTAPFGRDSVITALQTLMVNPDIARETLRFLARYQGETVDDWTEEQPGRIMHELRRGEMTACGEVPHSPYYGTADATPLFVVLLGELHRWTGDTETIRELLPHAERALRWIDDYGDADGDGLVEYECRSSRGLFNQGWKDSNDGVPYPDGSPAEPPIALVEVQGYVFAAKRELARIYAALGEGERAGQLRREARRLRRRIHDVFWLEDEGYFGLALDGEKRLLPTIASNAGHLLWSGVPTMAQARRMAEMLMGDRMFSGWGIRTLARRQPVYNPLSYHNGTIWPHDNALIALGLARYGFRREAATVLRALFEAALHFRYHRLPELFCGIWRGQTDVPVDYPVSCSPQAWAAGALFPLVQGVLGLEPQAHSRQLRLKQPYLPESLRFLDISNLRVGDSRVSLEFNRREDRTMANVTAVEGDPLHVRIDVL